MTVDQQNPDDVKKHVRSLQLILGFFLVSAIFSLGMGLSQEGWTATLFYTAAILCLIFCLIGTWLLSLAKRKSDP
jgi:hypothetical protein